MKNAGFHLIKPLLSATIICLVSSCYSYKPISETKDHDDVHFRNSVQVGATYRFKLKDGRTRELKVKRIDESKLIGSTVPFDVPETLLFQEIQSFERKRVSVLKSVGIAAFLAGLVGVVVIPTVYSSSLSGWWN